MAPRPLLWQATFSTLQSHKTLEKHNALRLFSTFSATLIFFLLTVSLLWLLPPLLLHLSLLEVWLLNFLWLLSPSLSLFFSLSLSMAFSIHPSIHPSLHPSIHPIHPPIHPSIFLPEREQLCQNSFKSQEWRLTWTKRSKSARLPQKKRNNSARFPPSSNWQHQKRSILRDVLQKWQFECSRRPRTNAFCDFSTPCVSSCACHEK